MSNNVSGTVVFDGDWLTGGGGQPVVSVGSTGSSYVQKAVQQKAPVTSAPSYTLLGEQFAVHPTVAFGEAERQGLTANVWCVSQETLDFLRSEPGVKLHRKINQLRDARVRGETVVRGIVTRNPRRPDPAPRPQRATLDDLQSRVKALITQIAEMLDRGPIPEAQMGELTSMTARLQAEMAEARNQLDEVDSQLAMARGLIVAYHTDPVDEERE